MNLHCPRTQECICGRDELSLWNDMHNWQRELCKRGGSGFHKWKRVNGAIRRAAGMRLGHSCTAAFAGHFLAALFLGRSHRLSWQNAIQQRQSEYKERQKPDADFALQVQSIKFTYTNV